MATIKAPFNFVPLNDKVFFPDWADKISQDIPFEDGVSGTIDLKITAQTPIFVRNGHTKKDAEEKNEEYASFSKTSDNKYFIPATSIKGCIRNVLEIMSFGKITQVENQSFGKRDLKDSSYTSLMRKVKCGWLYQDKDGYIIENHGTPKRISIKEIDKLLGKEDTLYTFITETDFSRDSDKLAKKKYEIIYKIKNKNIDMSTKEGYEEFVFSNDYLLSNNDGTFVLTGQSSKRYYDSNARKPKTGKDGNRIGCWKGKEKEFLFPSKCLGKIKVDDDIFKAFETIHKDSEDYYSFWKKKLHKGQQIPVFFILENNKLHSFGLTVLYKYPYNKSVYDAIPAELKNPERNNKDNFKRDLAECLFGFTLNDIALRGRVHFGNAFAQGCTHTMDKKTFISATPHPSFYPIYVKNGYDWDMANIISGRKRYPIRKQIMNTSSGEGTARMEQTCTMLSNGSIFNEKITFHNLKPVELGALLSALTFHKNQDKCFHNIGFGKPYGYGVVKISNIELNFVDNSKDYYMLEFEKEMEKHFPNWRNMPAITELFTMAQGIPVGQDNKFQYLTMSNNREDNEFVSVKNNEEYLNAFSTIINSKYAIHSVKDSFVSFEEEQKVKREERKRLEEKHRKEREEQKKKEENFASLDFSFLVNETKFKVGWDRLKKKLNDSGKDFDNNTFSQLSDGNQVSIIDFCKRMFERKDSKWGGKNNDYAKIFAIDEVKKVIGKGYTEL
ncbi:MAG: TIGR03986 family CRISPR-associated RAMP protein [Paludibacteraceae bacterium]